MNAISQADQPKGTHRWVDLDWAQLLISQVKGAEDLPRFFVSIPYSDPEGVTARSFIVAAEDRGTAYVMAKFDLFNWLAGVWDLDDSDQPVTEAALSEVGVQIGSSWPIPFSELFAAMVGPPEVLEANMRITQADKIAAQQVGDAIEREKGLTARLQFETERSDVVHEEMRRRSRPSAFSKLSPLSAA